MNNDTNNNLNGTVLGNVNNNPMPNNPIPNNPIETLDGGVNSTVMAGNQVMNNGISQPTPMPQEPVQSQVMANQTVNSVGVQNEVVTPVNPQPTVLESQPVEPMPAYTNPQTINPAPMPGFENSGTIGTTPPISLEPSKKPKKSSNKLAFIIIILVLLAGVGFGTYYVLNYTDLLNSKEQTNIVPKDLEIDMGSTLSTIIGDYATITGTDPRNCSLDTTQIDINKEGIYEFKVICGEIIKNGNIKVVDNTVLVVETKTLYKTKNDTLEAKEFAKNDDNLIYEFVDQAQVDSILAGDYGTYTVKIKATNENNKTAEVDATLVLMEHPIKGHLICSTNEQNVTDVSATMTVAEKFAIVDDGNNGYGKIAEEIHTFKFSDETEYTNYLAAYKTENKVTINNITGMTSFDDATLTITITNELDNTEVISEYGEANMAKYSSIKSYFEGTLGYTCVYNNVN